MFGYVKPLKPELKICEFEAYKAVYCGLCGELGRSFGPLARFTLSYDFTFISMLYFALSDETAEISKHRCYVNPFNKTPCVKKSHALSFGADLAAIMLYYKLCDNLEDSGRFGKIGWGILKPFASSARKKASESMPEADEAVFECMKKQARIEAEKRPSLDEASEPTAASMSKILRGLSGGESASRVLERFGYFLGRYVYLCDALDDLESDLKNGGYNPLILKFNITTGDDGKIKEARKFARDSLYMTIAEAAKAYDLLLLNDFKSILDNIMYLGLRNSVDILYNKPLQSKSL